MRIEHSAGGVVTCGGKILLVYQKRTKSWSFPKGHIRDGESTLQAARREIWEESGLTNLHLVKRIGTYTRGTRRTDKVHKCITMFLFSSKKQAVSPREEDVQMCAWVLADEVPSLLTYQEDAVFFERVQHGRELASSRIHEDTSKEPQ